MTLSTSLSISVFPRSAKGPSAMGRPVNIRFLKAIFVKTGADGPSCPTRSWVLGQPFNPKVSTASWLLFNRIQ